MAIAEKELLSPKITEIESLSDLRKYACPRYRHMSEWYLKCVDCPSRKTCPTGKQAVRLMESTTAPVTKDPDPPKPIPDPKTDIKGYIEYVFSLKDPVRELLSTAGNIRPQSVYARVNLWRKNYPDLEEKYHMLEKIRFLWTKPYNSMKIEDILKKLYPPEGPQHDFQGKYAEYSVVNPSRQQQEENKMEEGISLEDFLNQNPVTAKETPDIPKKIFHTTGPVSGKSAGKPSDISAGGGSGDLDALLERLRKNIAEYEQKIQQTKEQIAAVLTVQNLMRNGA